MRTLAVGLFFLSLVALMFSACGTQSSGGSGGAGPCAGITFAFNPDLRAECDLCVQQICCVELHDCQKADPHCIECANYSFRLEDPPCPDVKYVADALRTCSRHYCKNECWPVDICYKAGHPPDGGGCNPPEPDGGVVSTECAAIHTTILRGTVDGKPYDQTFETNAIGFQQIWPPFYFTSNIWSETLQGNGAVHMVWDGVCLDVNTPPVHVISGFVALPDDGKERAVEPCSGLWLMHDPATQYSVYRFNLLLENGDQLTGCARP